MNDVILSHHRWSSLLQSSVGRMDREWRLALLPQPPWPYVLFPVGWISSCQLAGYPNVFSDVIHIVLDLHQEGIAMDKGCHSLI